MKPQRNAPLEATDPVDEALVDRALAGDQAAFGVIVERHVGAMHRLAWRYLKDEALAEEATQEAFARAWTHLGRYRGESGLRPWLYRITANLCRDLLRSPSRRERSGETDGGMDVWPAPESLVGGADEDMARRRALEAVEAALEALPVGQREVLMLRLVEGLSYETISGMLGVPVGALKVRTHRARRRLREALGDLLDGILEDAA